MLPWFADLPIERKLRVVITFPALAAFLIALAMHVAMNVMHLREDLRGRATRIASVCGVSVIQAVEAGDSDAALKALGSLRNEDSLTGVAISLPDGRPLASYRRGPDDIRLEPIARGGRSRACADRSSEIQCPGSHPGRGRRTDCRAD